MRRLRLAIVVLLASACGADSDEPADPSGALGDDGDTSDTSSIGDEDGADGERDAASDARANDGNDSSVDAGSRRGRDAGPSDAASEPAARPGRTPSGTRDAAAGSSVDGSSNGSSDNGSSDGGPSSGDAGSACPAHGNVTYTLTRAAAPSAEQSAAYTRITRAMDTALEKYNCYTNLSRALRVVYEPSVATADGNTNGNIRFGSQASMNFVTAMHETGHTFGVGGNEFKAKVRDGRFDGPTATAEMRRITGKPDEFVHSDGTHFWPFGLNYENEYKSEADAVSHCQLVVAIRKDLGQ